MLCKRFLLFHRLPFHFVISFAMQKLFNFDVVLHVDFCFSCLCVWCIIYKKCFQGDFFPLMFSSRSVMGLGLTFKSLIHFELIFFFEWYKTAVQINSFACGYPVFSTPFIEETIFLPTECFWCPIKDLLTVYTWIYFWVFHSALLVLASNFIPVSYCLNTTALSSVQFSCSVMSDSATPWTAAH